MGRGRAKAKQTKVARDLKYRTHEADFGALARELHGDDRQRRAPTSGGRSRRRVVGLRRARAATDSSPDLRSGGAGPGDRRARSKRARSRAGTRLSGVSASQMPAQPADVAHPALGEPVGGHGRR